MPDRFPGDYFFKITLMLIEAVLSSTNPGLAKSVS